MIGDVVLVHKKDNENILKIIEAGESINKGDLIFCVNNGDDMEKY